MKICLIIVATLFLFAAWFSWFGRYTTNTAGGRFYKSDRWTGNTIVVEKNGDAHLLDSKLVSFP